MIWNTAQLQYCFRKWGNKSMMFNSAETVDFFLRLKVFEAKNSTTFNALLQSMIQEPFFSFFFQFM